MDPIVLGAGDHGHDVLVRDEHGGLERGVAAGNRDQDRVADQLERGRLKDARERALDVVLQALELAKIALLAVENGLAGKGSRKALVGTLVVKIRVVAFVGKVVIDVKRVSHTSPLSGRLRPVGESEQGKG